MHVRRSPSPFARLLGFPVMPTVAMALLVLAAAGCDEPAAASDTAPEAPTNTAKAAAPEAASKRKTVATKGEVLARKGEKVAFSIDLPEGLKDVSDAGYTREYRRGKDEFDGYSFTIGIDPQPRPLEAEVARYTTLAKQSPGKKMKMLANGEFEGGGWYVAVSFEEGGKRNVTMMSSVVRGSKPALMCRGDANGSVITDESAAADVLRETCDSLVLP